MRRVTIVVIGNGKSNRSNVESLISDVADSMDEVTIATVYGTKQSEGQVWAEQWAQDKEIPVLQYPENNYDALFSENPLDEIQFFLLWSDEDGDCQLACSKAQEYKIRAFDLLEGLISIDLGVEPIVVPATPPVHDVVEEQPALMTIEEVLAEPEEEPSVVIDLDLEIKEVLEELAELLAEKLIAKVTAKLQE